MSSVHTVGKGECLYSIAKVYGFHDWKKIYDAPENENLKKARPDPNVLFAGDQLFIPDREDSKKKVGCTTEQLHKFKVKLTRVLFRVCVKDEEDKPIAGKKFRLRIGDERLDGTTDGDGIVEHRIPAHATSAKLFVFLTGDEEKGEHFMWDVGIGHLDPSRSDEGVEERLNNLGFPCGEREDDDDDWPSGMEAAVRTFQKLAKMKVTGELDDATVDKLKEVHGKV